MARTIAVLVARLIFSGLFVMATSFKFFDMPSTAGYIAGAGLPFPLVLAWSAAVFEAGLAFAFLTGAFFSEAALLAGIYVIFLAFAFHGRAIGKAIRRSSASSSTISRFSPVCCSLPYTDRTRGSRSTLV